MKIAHDVVVTLGVAVLTALLAAPFVGPLTARAEDENAVPLPVTDPSTLVAEGMTLSLKLENEEYEPGARPVLLLTAVGGAKGATGEVVVRMRTTPPVSPMARMMSLPREVWAESVSITLEPGETRTIELAPDSAVSAGSTAMFEIEIGEARLTAARYSIPAPPLTQADAGARSLGAPETDLVAKTTAEEVGK